MRFRRYDKFLKVDRSLKKDRGSFNLMFDVDLEFSVICALITYSKEKQIKNHMILKKKKN